MKGLETSCLNRAQAAIMHSRISQVSWLRFHKTAGWVPRWPMVLTAPSISQLSLEGAKLLLGQGPHCDLNIGALILYARTLGGE